MIRYYIYLFTVINNKVCCFSYNVRHFEVNNIYLSMYPIDYSDVIRVHLDPSIRFEVVPYRHLLELDRGESDSDS